MIDLKRLRILAIIVGVIIDLGGTNIATACYSIFMLTRLATEFAAQGLTRQEIQAQLQGGLRPDTRKS